MDTAALLLGLEILPKRKVEDRGRTLEEFDLDVALARRPKLILIDELAHTNWIAHQTLAGYWRFWMPVLTIY